MESPPRPGGTRGAAVDATLEVKTQAIIIFWKHLAVKQLGKMAAYEFAAKKTRQSIDNVRKLVAMEDGNGVGGVASKRENCGRKTAFSPRKQSRIDELMKENDGEASIRQISMALQEVGVGQSLDTAQNYLDKAGYERLVKRVKTLLSPEHLSARQLYCDHHFEDSYSATAMGDEKLFVLGRGNRFYYAKAEDGDQPCYRFVHDKQHPPQVMVTAWVMRPQLDKGFDGKLGLWLSCPDVWYQAKYNTKNRPRGTWLLDQNATLDGKGYYETMDTQYLPAMAEVRKKLGLRELIAQDDNAKPHDKAWNSLGLDARAQRHGVKRGDQPARSPDLNVLDLYVWRVLEKGVFKHRPKTVEQLWDVLQKVWEEDLTSAKLECAFRLLQPVMAAITACGGGNTFKLPHSGIRKEMSADGWDI